MPAMSSRTQNRGKQGHGSHGRAGGSRATSARTPIGAAMLVAWTLAGCGPTRLELDAPPNVLLIVVDTLGAKHLGCYGADVPTPSIDALASAGVRFERAYASAPWTKPSVASLFTSERPATHGVQGLTESLGDEATTLAELLSQAGYRTHGVISHELIDARYGFDQGFDSYNEKAVLGHGGISSNVVTNQALQWLARSGSESDRPFLLFAHYFDPHYVYWDHKAFDLVPKYEGEIHPAMDIWNLRDRRADLKPEDLDYLRGLYREEVALVDREIGRLIDGLEELGLREDTLVILTADHGEELMEHGWLGHTRTLYDELLRVPLVMSLPGTIDSATVGQHVSLLDVVPTVMELAARQGPRIDWQGTSLVPFLADPARAEPRGAVYAEVAFVPLQAPNANGVREFGRNAEKIASLTGVIDERWKLIHNRLSDEFELFDLESDPNEMTNLWGRDPNLDSALKSRLQAWESAGGDDTQDGALVSEEELERLRALGYAR